MLIITISGSYSNIGKTTLAKNICSLLPTRKVLIIKVGHNKFKPGKDEILFNKMDDALDYIHQLKIKNELDFLIVESNSLFDYLKPDLAILLRNSEKPEKESAQLALKYADIIIDGKFDPDYAKTIIQDKIGPCPIIKALTGQFDYMFKTTKIDKIMIHPDEAMSIVLNSAKTLASESAKVIDSIGRILATDVFSEIDLPPFDKSAMDGYAYNSSDTSEKFKIVETIAAGDIPKIKLKNGECSKIMTGAILPEGADRVIRVEYTTETDNLVSFLKPDEFKHICYKAEDVKKGDKILDKGTLIRFQEISSLSTIGLDEVPVYKQPIVGLITTGSELLKPGQKIEPGKIYDSNCPLIYNKLRSLPVPCIYYGILEDDKKLISEYLSKALSECDVLIFSGGVSMGEFDYIPEVLSQHGIELKFEKVAIKPGKPTVFGVKDNKYLFGLPGNPVSTFTIFEIFVKPLLYKLMGHDYHPPVAKGILSKEIKRKTIDRVEYIPVSFDGEFIYPIDYHGSGHILSLNKANSLIKMDQNISKLEKGTQIVVRYI